MSGDARARALTDLVSRFGRLHAPSGASVDPAVATAVREGVFPTRTLGPFLQVLRGRTAPVVLDLGPVVGANVTFLGEELGCKLFVEDLFADLDRLSEADEGEPVSTFLSHRIGQDDASVDGVLCWDVLENLDEAGGRMLAAELTRVLAPGGALLASFGSEVRSTPGHTKYEIIDASSLRHRFEAGASGQTRVMQSREVTQMFDGLAIADSFLLKSQTREMLFRKALGRATGAN